MRRLVFGACFVIVGCAPRLTPATFPRTFASEAQDAWLHEHCVSCPLMRTEAGCFDDDMRKVNANFAEVIADQFETSGKHSFVLKPFRCVAKPPWYSADRTDAPEDL